MQHQVCKEFFSYSQGMHRATFNRILSELREKGILGKVTKKRIQILDLNRLVHLAEGTYAL